MPRYVCVPPFTAYRRKPRQSEQNQIATSVFLLKGDGKTTQSIMTCAQTLQEISTRKTAPEGGQGGGQPSRYQKRRTHRGAEYQSPWPRSSGARAPAAPSIAQRPFISSASVKRSSEESVLPRPRGSC